MTVIYDLLGFQSRDHGERGIARYVLNLALALERTNPGLVSQYLADPRLPFPAGAEALIATGRVVPVDRGEALRRPSGGGVFIAGSLFEMQESLDRVLPPWARSPHWRTMTVLYDLIPLKFKDWYLYRADVRHAQMARAAALNNFDRLLAISQASADDVVSILGFDPDRIAVIGAGADHRFRPPRAAHREVAQGLVVGGRLAGLRPGYVLFPSGIERRKNIERTIEAYGALPAELRAQHQLVLVCRLDDYARKLLSNLTAEAGVSGQVLATGFVDDDTLCRLYQGSELVIFPSIYEGFGLPVLEAMQCGAPVICADSSSLREVQTLSEARFDPESTIAITAALERGLTDEEFVDRLRSQDLPPFTWDNAARLTVEAMSALNQADQLRRSLDHGPVLPRLALVSPLPPQHSGIATYAYRLLEELRHHCEVTVFVDADADAGDVVAPPGVAVEPLNHLDPIVRGGGAFDRILYFMGNSRFHVEMLEVLRAHPGWVLLHDVRLSGLYSEVHRLAPERLIEESVGATLVALYPHRYRSTVEAMESIPPDVAYRFGVWLTREVVSRADQVLVHSVYGANLITLDAGVDPLVLYPHPCPTRPGPARPSPGPPVIATFGIVAPVKQPEVLVSAMPVVHQRVPDARLRFVGEIEDHHRRDLLALAQELGVDHCVEFVGHLDDDEFQAAQQASTVAVQLRSVTNGESSGAVADLLALGVPTVVSNLGAMTELPDEAVAKVDPDLTGAEMGQVLAELLLNQDRRAALIEGGQCYARANSFARAAAVLARTLFA